MIAPKRTFTKEPEKCCEVTARGEVQQEKVRSNGGRGERRQSGRGHFKGKVRVNEEGVECVGMKAVMRAIHEGVMRVINEEVE